MTRQTAEPPKRAAAGLADWRDEQANSPEDSFRAARQDERQQHAQAFEQWRKTRNTQRRETSTAAAGKELTMTMKNLNDLFVATLKDLYFVEKKLVQTLPKMADKANSNELKKAIEEHLTETETHVTRLEKVFEMLGQRAVGKTCEALEGLVREADKTTAEIDNRQTLDAAIISSAQTVEHYEIARYGTLACWASEMGNSDIANLLEQTLEEEKAADEKLSMLAEGSINRRAA